MVNKIAFVCVCFIYLATTGCSLVTRSSAQTDATTGSQQAPYHIVRKGETLYSIAWHYGQDYRTVAIWNDIDYPYLIKPGQYIYLQPDNARSVKTSWSTSRTGPRRTTTTSSQLPKIGATRASKPKATIPKTTTKSQNKSSTASTVRWIWPTQGKMIEKYSFGRGKKGIVIAGRSGQRINAAATGRVVYTGSGLQGYGKLIIIKHNDTFLSAYAHNKKIRVKEQEKVKRGQHIADMGKSGTDKSSLHFEIRRNGKPINPLRYLPKP